MSFVLSMFIKHRIHKAHINHTLIITTDSFFVLVGPKIYVCVKKITLYMSNSMSNSTESNRTGSYHKINKFLNQSHMSSNQIDNNIEYIQVTLNEI